MTQNEEPIDHPDNSKYDPLLIEGLKYLVGVKNQFLASYVSKILNKEVKVVGKVDILYACPCCLYRTLEDRGQYDICPVCFWEDDGNDEQTLTNYSWPNRMTLKEARENFELVGACDQGSLRFIEKDARQRYYKSSLNNMEHSEINFYQLQENLEEDIKHLNPTDLEEKYYEICIKLAGLDYARKIYSLSLESYKNELRDRFQQALTIAEKAKAKAIYFEYDMDNSWSSAFYIHEEYNPQEYGDDDWACDWIDQVDGPFNESFAQIYKENGFDVHDCAIGTHIYLIARTVALLVEIVREFEVDMVVGIGFHDQDPIMRINGE